MKENIRIKTNNLTSDLKQTITTSDFIRLKNIYDYKPQNQIKWLNKI